jgi:transposase-like protein
MKSLSCPNRHCSLSSKGKVGGIIRHGFYTARWGKRRRYQCRSCGKTFCSTTGTPYYQLQHRRTVFDEVAALSVEGLNKSAIDNFVRPHRALKFGREVRTPARQAGLTKRALTFREIFSSRLLFLTSKNVLFALFETVRPGRFPIRGVPLAA